MLQALNFVFVHVPDVEAATPFYTEALGLEVEARQPGFVQFRQPAGGGATYALGQGPALPEGAELWWMVDAADATHDALVARGVEIVSPPADEPFGRAFAIKDPAGTVLHMWQPRRQG